MKFSTLSRHPLQASGDIIVLPLLDKKLFPHDQVKAVDEALGGLVKKMVEELGLKGEPGESLWLNGHGDFPFQFIQVVSLGAAQDLTPEIFRRASAQSAKEGAQRRRKNIVSLLPLAKPEAFQDYDLGQSLVEGAELALYRFDQFRGRKTDPQTLKEISFFLGDSIKATDFSKGMKSAEIACEGVVLARNLVNTPSRDKPPVFLAEQARKITGIETKVFDHKKIQKMGMGALYGVGMGSGNPPVFVEMHYKPKTKARHRVAIVGKGITFDSGGLSLKPPKSMETMKDDMAGAAAVLGVMSVLPRLKIPVEVYGYIASAENMPDGSAQRPGDVVTAYNGTTIEVLNTDAEGRLALADALSYLTKHRQVDYIIDLATLTGAALVALGDLYTAALGTDDELIQRLKEAGEFCGEKLWQLPLAKEYNEYFKSDVADLQNIGGQWAGTISGALFLKNFVDEKAKWAHLDIAGPSWANSPWPYSSKGGTGIMVRTLLKFFNNL